MRTFALQSGSNGNAFYVEADGVRLMFDAGISARRAKLRMAEHQLQMHGLTALLLSHDHTDHARHAGTYHRLFNVPVYCTEPTYLAARHNLGPIRGLRHFRAGDVLEFGGGAVRVHTIPTPHDAADGVCFVVESAAARLGVFTDLGHPFLALQAALNTCDAAYIESNYDPDMLANGPYPERLRARIRGDGGHLSNREAAELLARCPRRLRWAALAHLSHENNHADVALRTHRDLLGADYPLAIASRFAATEMFRFA